MQPLGDLQDTIVAVASPAGAAAVGLVRLSGPAATSSVASLVVSDGSSPDWDPREGYRGKALVLDVRGAEVAVWATVFLAARSYTGEDVVELSLCGSPVLLGAVAASLASRPALRWAGPGEFTLRAFLHGRLDLSQAEAVAATVAAAGEEEARAARRGLRGELGERFRALADKLVETLALLEAGLDFPDEELPEVAPAVLGGRLADVEAELDELERRCGGRAAGDATLRVVLAGWPNSGKSTLLNAVLGREAAIATRHPGTTRDPVRGVSVVAGRRIEWTDLAGFRSLDDLLAPASGSAAAVFGGLQVGDDAVWEIVRRMSVAELDAADVVVWVVDPFEDPPRALAEAGGFRDRPLLVVVTKSDLLDGASLAAWRLDERCQAVISAASGDGVEALVSRVVGSRTLPELPPSPPSPPRYLVSAHQLGSLSLCREAVERAGAALSSAVGSELVAADLRDALAALEDLTGTVTADAVLDRVFSRFCIGK